MKFKAFGLDIGASSIKAVWLAKNNNKYSLESIVSTPASSKGVYSEAFFDQQILGESIKKMVSDANIGTPNVNISMPQSQVFLKVIEMPELSERELQAAIIWEMEQQVPMPFDQVKTDWQILEHRERNGERMEEILLVAAPLNLLEKYAKVINLAGLSMQAIETEIISVHRTLMPLLSESGADLVINLGASTTDIAITRNKIINIVFSVPLGGIAITRAISTDLGIDIMQAENFKRAYGLSKEAFEGKIGKSLIPILESIVSDIRKAMLLFREKNGNESIKQVILSGGSALLPKIDTFFTDALDTQVVIGNGWQINNIENVPQEVLIDSPSYNSVLGLALREI